MSSMIDPSGAPALTESIQDQDLASGPIEAAVEVDRSEHDVQTAIACGVSGRPLR